MAFYDSAMESWGYGVSVLSVAGTIDHTVHKIGLVGINGYEYIVFELYVWEFSCNQ